MHYMNDILQNYTLKTYMMLFPIVTMIYLRKQPRRSSVRVPVFQLSLEKSRFLPRYRPRAVCFQRHLSVINIIKAGRERSLARTPSREVLPPAPPASGACWTHLSPILLSENSCGWLETSHGGRIYTLEISKCYKAGLPFPLKKVHLPAHDCPILLYIPSTKKAKGYISFQPRFVSYQAQRSYKALNQYFILLGGKLKQF